MSNRLHIKGAHIWDGTDAVERDLYIEQGRIATEKPRDALVIDLDGYLLFPGLINAHDHLELNHYPRTKFRQVYGNAHQWGEDVNARLEAEPFRTLQHYPIWERLFIGGIKNLLCGATTVIHHGAKYRQMFRKDFPVKVLKDYGWAHSLHFDSKHEIVRRFKATPPDVPWFIHLAEGTDAVAADEYRQLRDLGCFDINRTVIVHAVNWLEQDDLDESVLVRGFIWCPTTNFYLLNQTMPREFVLHYPELNAIALGSDSRLTADGDLLDELHAAIHYLGDDDATLRYVMAMLFFDAPFIAYGVSERDYAFEQPSADFIAVPYGDNAPRTLCNARRSDLSLVMRDGIPKIGTSDMLARFPQVQTVACRVDGTEKRLHLDLAKQVHRCTLKEDGLEVDDLPTGKRFFFF